MRVVVERDSFASALSAIARSVERRDTIPILNNVLLRPNGIKIDMAGTDMDMQMETSVEAEISAKEASVPAVTVKASVLSGIVSQLPRGAQVSMEWAGEKTPVILKSGRSRYNLVTLPSGDFPNLKSPQEPITFSLPGKVLAAQLNAVKFAISKEVTRPYLTGIAMLKGTDKHPAFGGGNTTQLEFVATNGHQLGRSAIPFPPEAEGIPPIIIPDRAVSEIARLCGETSDDVTLAIAANCLKVTMGGNVFSTKLIDGTFPDHPHFTPRDNRTRIGIDIDQLTQALQRLHQLGDDLRTRAEFTSGSLKISLINQATGEAEETIECDHAGPDLTVGINASQILGNLAQIDADTCQFHFGDAGVPVLMYALRGGETDYTRLYLCTLVHA